MCSIPRHAVYFAALCAASPAFTQPAPGESASASLAPYHDYDQLGARLRELSVDPRADLRSLGQSADGRDIWLLTLAGPDPVPAVYVDAAHDGRDVTAGEVALAVAEHFLALPSDSLDSILATATIHIAPRVSPDAVEYSLRNPASDGRIPQPADDDRDGVDDEDAPADITGDGMIATMRVADPAGKWVADPVDDRILVVREDGDHGPFFRRYDEGLDDDGDGLVNEDPAGGVNILHNFPQGWEMPIVEPSGGPFATSESETIAVLEHLVNTPEVAFVVTLSQGQRPELPGIGTRPASDSEKSGYAWIESIWKDRVERTFDVDYESPGPSIFGGAGQFWPEPVKKQASTPTPRAVVSGSFLEWAHFQGGMFAVSPQVWVHPPTPAATDSAAADSAATPSDDDTAKDEPDKPSEPRDEVAHGWLEHAPDLFIPWEPFDHPTLGAVEVGGMASLNRLYATDAEIDSMAADIVHLVEQVMHDMARVELSDVTATPLAGSIVRVGATVTNTGRVATLSALARASKLLAPLRVEILIPDGAQMVDTPARASLGHLEPGERRRVEWLVRVPAGGDITVRAHSARAGHAAETIEIPTSGYQGDDE